MSEQKTELSKLRVSKLTGGAASKLAKISGVRKSIARFLTVYNQQARATARELHKGQKYQPKDLRVKKTRAIRRALAVSRLDRRRGRRLRRRRIFL